MALSTEAKNKILEERRRQLKVLRDDMEAPCYEKAHLALYLLQEIDRGFNSRWLQLLSRANKAVLRRDCDMLGKILAEMGEIVGEAKETAKDGE